LDVSLDPSNSTDAAFNFPSRPSKHTLPTTVTRSWFGSATCESCSASASAVFAASSLCFRTILSPISSIISSSTSARSFSFSNMCRYALISSWFENSVISNTFGRFSFERSVLIAFGL